MRIVTYQAQDGLIQLYFICVCTFFDHKIIFIGLKIAF